MNDSLVREWVAKAEEDFRVVSELYEKSPSDFATTICYHAQQCIEKYLKALLVKEGIEPPWIHTLETLLDLFPPTISLEQYRSKLAKLTPYGTEYRYPGREATAEEAKMVVVIVKDIREALRAILTKS